MKDLDPLVVESNLTVVRANLSHLDAMVQIHLEAFKGFFLESLGKQFLKKLYRSFILETSGLCLVAVERKCIVGFVVGTTQPEGFFRRLLWSRWIGFVLAGTTALTLHPIRVGKKFFSALRYRGERPFNLPDATLLSSIGVVPSAHGRGIGKILIYAFCQSAQEAGSPTVFVTTDRNENDAVNQFYLSSGFKLHGSFLREQGRWMNLYVRSLPKLSE